MAVDTKHPLYLEFDQDWIQLRDSYRGERIVKEAGFKYLPATAGMEADGIVAASDAGTKAYAAYRMRSRFPGFVKEAVEAMLGVMHHKEAVIELPAKLESLLERATLKNESLQGLLRRINEEQLITGRLGLLLDVPDTDGAALPYLALYKAEDLWNWDEGERDEVDKESLNLVVIDESSDERTKGTDAFSWEHVKKKRILVLGDVDANEAQGEGVYRVGVFRDDETFKEEGLIEPHVAGTTLDRIPFVFINTKDVVATPDDAPLLDLSNLCFTVYRGEADYRQALFMQGQDTFVIVGGASGDDEDTRVGAGATLHLPMGGSADYRGVGSLGLSEMREALTADYERGNQKAGALLEAVSRSAESGEALRVRVAARTASLNQIALAGAFGLEEILKTAAIWVGANPEEVSVEPNLDFVADIMAGQELTALVAAKGLGAPLSLASLHELMRERGLTQKTFEEEIAEMMKESEEGMPGAGGANEDDEDSDTAQGVDDEGNPIDPDDDDDDDDKDKGKKPAPGDDE